MTLLQHPQYRNLWGYVQYARSLESRSDLDRWAPTFLAGQFGEALLLGFAGPGASQDTTMVRDQIRAFISDRLQGHMFFQQALDQARAIVQDNPEPLRQVAEALLQRRTLTRVELQELLESQPEP